MLRRCIWELSSARSVHRRLTSQMPFLLSSRKEFSNTSQRDQSQRPAPPGKISAEEPSHRGNAGSKLVLGTVVFGSAFLAAYQTGYIDQFLQKGEESSPKSTTFDSIKAPEDLKQSVHEEALQSDEKTSTMMPNADIVEDKDRNEHLKVLNDTTEDVVEEKAPEEGRIPVEVNESAQIAHETPEPTAEQTMDPQIASDDSSIVNNKDPVKQNEMDESESSTEQNDRIDGSNHVSEETGITNASHEGITIETPKVSIDEEKVQKSLAHSYSLQEDELPDVFVNQEKAGAFLTKSEDKEDPKDINKPEDGRILLDLIDAIHAAERKQAETDAFIFAEEKRKLKEKYEKDLKDARARELMYAEEAALLDKELNKEKAKAAATIKLLEENAEKHLREELQHKEEEAQEQVQKVKDLAKAELAATIAAEKSSQIERIAEANLNINALCMAFYARSEEARQSHSIHKLALGTLALEDALSQGLPIRAEIDALHKSLDGIDRDSLLSLALSSLPEEILSFGTYTQMQLNQKFDSLKGTLRHFSLIPAGGGGILAHTVAHIASSIKMKGGGDGDNIESLICRVEKYLLDGNLAEAADTLEVGVRGSEAEGAVIEWVRQARNRAIAEQALAVLQSYASSITFA
ncbi:Mitochondrial inner membrane protein Mitofilin protein [Dioscorea alata]|uniref:Mitochondrial inner membrane protein Mitofilin protein n=1 Tax=Dioscorea alata TaxID=55571 RepID=A0ACB7TXE5_DIOAL|nr:Mitochondrial inner membrane protein Mitofilin protein [Dioscorea alata]